MAKSNSHKNWLNVVIITISGLILAFTLLGRFFDSGELVDSQNDSQQIQRFELVAIDFGELQLNKNLKQWSVLPGGSLAQIQINQLVDQWELLLRTEMQFVSGKMSQSIRSATTVLLYLKGKNVPLICKVVFTENQAFVEFLASEQTIEISLLQAQKLLPKSKAVNILKPQPGLESQIVSENS